MKLFMHFLLIFFVLACTKEGYIEIKNETKGNLNVTIGGKEYKNIANDKTAKKTITIQSGLTFEPKKSKEVKVSGNGEWKSNFSFTATVKEDETTKKTVARDTWPEPVYSIKFEITELTQCRLFDTNTMEFYPSVATMLMLRTNTGNVDPTSYEVWFSVICTNTNAIYTIYHKGFVFLNQLDKISLSVNTGRSWCKTVEVASNRFWKD